MTKTVVIINIKKRLGFSKKNNAQRGFIIPTTKNRIVHKAKSNA
jgi:hypothetical protein